MNEIYLTIICEVKNYPFFPSFSAKDVGGHVSCRFRIPGNPVIAPAENECILLLTDQGNLARAFVNREQSGIFVIYVGEYEAVKAFAHRLEDIWYPFDEPDMLRLRLKWAVRRIMDYPYWKYLHKRDKKEGASGS